MKRQFHSRSVVYVPVRGRKKLLKIETSSFGF